MVVTKGPMTEIRSAEIPRDLGVVRGLFQEYVDSLAIDLYFQELEQELASLPGKYSPPGGRLLLAWRGDEPVGCIALRPIDAATCEMKRLYVRPQARGEQLGRRLAERICREAKDAGYTRISPRHSSEHGRGAEAVPVSRLRSDRALRVQSGSGDEVPGSRSVDPHSLIISSTKFLAASGPRSNGRSSPLSITCRHERRTFHWYGCVEEWEPDGEGEQGDASGGLAVSAFGATLVESLDVPDRGRRRNRPRWREPSALHFRVTGSDAAGLDALRETRRAVIREDWALGLEDGEPSLADAMFTSHDVYWDVPLGERQRCREKIQALVVRTNRRLEQARGARSLGRLNPLVAPSPGRCGAPAAGSKQSRTGRR